MKNVLRKRGQQVLLVVLFGMPILVSAQEKKQVRVRIEKDVNGNKTVEEKVINADGMSKQEKDKLIESFKDSVVTGTKDKPKMMRIEVQTDENSEYRIEDDRRIESHFNYNNDNGDEEVIIVKKPRKPKRPEDMPRWSDRGMPHAPFIPELPRMDEFGNHLKKAGKDMKFEIHAFHEGFLEGNSKTIKGIEVYPNNPKVEILNISFHAPEKGDISIKVLDLKGSVIAKEEIKDFSGEYVGQINVGKQRGTLFVMITQGEDGAVRRVLIPTK